MCVYKHTNSYMNNQVKFLRFSPSWC